MPLPHQKLASWYLQLAQSMESGVPLPGALKACRGAPLPGRIAMAQSLESGVSVDDVLRGAPAWFPKKDTYFWSAAAHTGRLPQTLRALADRHERMGAAKLKLVLGSIYPVGVMTLAGFLMPVMNQINFETGIEWSTADYLEDVALFQFPLWSVILILVVLAKTDSPILPMIAKWFPGFRGHRINQSLADLSYALGAFLEAGTPIGKAWAGAGLVTNDPPIVRASRAMSQLIENGGATPSEHLDNYRCFPDDFISLYTTGEKTGQLDHNLRILGQQFQARANRAMTFATVFYTALIMGGVMLMMVINILSFYGRYLSGITGIME